MGLGIGDLVNAAEDLGKAGTSALSGDMAGARNHLSEADSAITGDTTNAAAAAAQGTRDGATTTAEEQARSLQQKQQQLGTQLDGPSDGQSVASFENYAAHDHPELYAKAQEMSSSGSRDAAQGWTDLGSSLGGHFATLGQTLSSAIANGWEGDGAAAAAAGSARYVQQASALQPAFELTGSKLQEASSAAGATYTAVPPPVEFNRTHAVVHNLASVLSGGPPDADSKAQQAAIDAAHAEAVQVMDQTYKPMMVSADSGVPTFTAPGRPAAGDVAPTPPPGPGDPGTPGPVPWYPRTRPGEGYAGGTPNGQSPDGSAVPQHPGGQIAPSGTPATGGPSPAYGAAGGTDAGVGTGAGYGASPGYGASAGHGNAPGVGAGPGYSAGGPAAGVSSAGYTPPGFGAGGAPSGAGYGAGAGGYGAGAGGYGAGGGGYGAGSGGYGSGSGGYGAGGYGAGGYGSGGGAGGYGSGGYGAGGYGSGGGAVGGVGGSAGSGGYSSGGNGPGTGVGGGVGASGGAAGTGGGSGSGPAGAAGSSGARSGSAGGMGGGRGAKGEEDFEHNTPSYLITDEHGSEIVGTLPMVSPAVIGE